MKTNQSWDCPDAASPRWSGHWPLSLAALCLVTGGRLLLPLPGFCLSCPLYRRHYPGQLLGIFQPQLSPPLGSRQRLLSILATSIAHPMMGHGPLGQGWHVGRGARPEVGVQESMQTPSRTPVDMGLPLASRAGCWVFAPRSSRAGPRAGPRACWQGHLAARGDTLGAK